MTLLIAQQLDTRGLGAQLIQCSFDLAGLLEHPLGNLPIDVGAGQLLQQLGALVGVGLQKGRKTALGQQHGFGEALEIQTGEALGQFEFFIQLVGEDLPDARGLIDLHQLDFRCLQRAVALVAGPALAPEGAVVLVLDRKLDLGQAVGGVPGQQLVAAGRQRAHARRAVVQGQADGIQQGGLARSGRPGYGEQAVVLERLGGEVDLPFALQRIEVFQAQTKDLHTGSSASSATTCWYRPTRRACTSGSRLSLLRR